MGYERRLARLEAGGTEAALDLVAAELATEAGEPYAAVRAELAAEGAYVEGLYARLGSWEAVAATLAAALGVPVGKLWARAARWEA